MSDMPAEREAEVMTVTRAMLMTPRKVANSDVIPQLESYCTALYTGPANSIRNDCSKYVIIGRIRGLRDGISFGLSEFWNV